MWKKEFKILKNKPVKHNSNQEPDTLKPKVPLTKKPASANDNKDAKMNVSVSTHSEQQSKQGKNSLAKFVNKKPNFLKDTAGSRTKRDYGIQKAQTNRTKSREKNMLVAKEMLHKQKVAMQAEKRNNFDESGLLQIADEFWDNLEQEKQKSRKENNGRHRTPVSERTTFATKMKAKNMRRPQSKTGNQYFQNKFKHSAAYKPAKRSRSRSNEKGVVKRVISTPQEIGMKSPTPLKITKGKSIPQEADYYSPIQKTPHADSAPIKITNEYIDQNFDFEKKAKQVNERIEIHPEAHPNIDSTLHLTMDEKINDIVPIRYTAPAE